MSEKSERTGRGWASAIVVLVLLYIAGYFMLGTYSRHHALSMSVAPSTAAATPFEYHE